MLHLTALAFALDIGRFVTAVPIVAVFLVIVATIARIGRGGVGRPRIARSSVRRGNPVAGVAIGLIGLAAGGFMAVRSEAQLATYDAAPSCQAGFAAVPVADAPCRLRSARIVRAYHAGKHNTPTLVLRFDDGGVAHVAIARDVYGTLWTSAHNRTIVDATVQFEGTNITQVQTAAGQIESSVFPRHQLFVWTIVAIIFGSIGAISALTLAARAAF